MVASPFSRVGNGFPQHGGKAVPVKDIIAQHHGAGLAADEFLADQKSLRQSVRGGLHRILERNAELASVAQQLLEARRIRRRGNHQNIPNSRQHQRGQRVINHGLIVYRQKLLGSYHGQRIQSGFPAPPARMIPFIVCVSPSVSASINTQKRRRSKLGGRWRRN